MPELDYSSLELNGGLYDLTFAKFSSGDSKRLVAITDQEADIHYVSEELKCYSTDDLMPTSTIPGGYGMPSQIVDGVPVRVMDEIETYFRKDDSSNLADSLSKLGDDVLGSDSQENEVEVEEKLEALSWQGLDPDEIDEEQYPKM